jgi:alpha-1,3-fucosyltransferase
MNLSVKKYIEEILVNLKCKGCSLKLLILFVILSLTIILLIWDKNITKLHKKENMVIKCDPYMANLNIFSVKIDNEIYPKFIPLYDNQQINYECLNDDKISKVILLWTFSIFDYGMGKRTPFENNKCPVTNCEITNSRSRLNESSFIVFNIDEYIDSFPSYRTANQRWIFVSYQSPLNDGFDLRWKRKMEMYNNLFNLSATYRLDSNFTSLYYPNYIWTKNKHFDDNQDFSNKTEFAAIVINDCFSKSGRFNYVKEIQESIPVEIFGKCGKPCPILHDNGQKGDCKEIISKKYKFNFAFESSLCKDYVTEKFFEILPYDIIPVVYGYGSYSTYVPKSGFINALDYPSAKHLAEYLLFLDKNKTAYNSYFKWKKNIKFNNNGPRFGSICEMCLRLNLDIHEGVENHIITDMNQFWNAENNCNIIYAK